MTGTDVRAVVGERSDAGGVRPTSGPCGESGIFGWCEIQDGVCGNGLAIMESRDDDGAHDETAVGQTLTAIEGGSSFIDEKLKTFSQELSKPAERGSAFDVSNPATVSTLSGSPSKKSKYEQFILLVNSSSKTYGAQSIPVADLYVNMGMECSDPDADAKTKELALLLFEEAFTIYQAKLGDSHEQTIDCRVHLGLAYRALGRYDEALDCFCMAVYMREALRGELHPSVSEVWLLISSVHHARSKLELALKASAKALTGYRSAHGDKHSTVIGVLKEIAQIHVEMGNHDKATDIQKYVRLHSPKS